MNNNKKKIYLAPLEGITNYIFRNAYNDFYGGIDKYFSPFIPTHTNPCAKTRGLGDILPQRNEGICLVPQILTNNAQDLVQTLKDFSNNMGYKEYNLNIGCPSGTVVAKNKGAGLLKDTEYLDNFLYETYGNIPNDIAISVKTRIGTYSHDEFYEILDIYNKFPICELIIHPRIMTDMYKNSPNMDMWKYAVDNSKNMLCYNGDITTPSCYADILTLANKASFTGNVMIGRGILKNPGLTSACKNIADEHDDIMYDTHKFWSFYERLLRDYSEVMSGEKNILIKMKELWTYMIYSMGFDDNERDKMLHKIIKCRNIEEYNNQISTIKNLDN